MPVIAKIPPNTFILIFPHEFTYDLHRNDLTISQFWLETTTPDRGFTKLWINICYTTIYINDKVFYWHDGSPLSYLSSTK